MIFFIAAAGSESRAGSYADSFLVEKEINCGQVAFDCRRLQSINYGCEWDEVSREEREGCEGTGKMGSCDLRSLRGLRATLQILPVPKSPLTRLRTISTLLA